MKFTKEKIEGKSKVNQRVFRLIKLYVQLTSEKNHVDIDKYCFDNKITERTLRRDIKTLKEIFPELPFSYNRKWRKT